MFLQKHDLQSSSGVELYKIFEGLQVRNLTAEGSPRVHISIVEEYAHQIGT